ncbi:hypothetical protein V1527DRAFT_472905 [Lipomyces starkeyi]
MCSEPRSLSCVRSAPRVVALPSATLQLSTANALNWTVRRNPQVRQLRYRVMSATVSKDMPPMTHDTIISEYEEVFNLLTENPPEQILDVQVPSTTTTDFDGERTARTARWRNHIQHYTPTSAYDDIEDVRTEIATMRQSAVEPMGWYESHGYYRPIFY